MIKYLIDRSTIIGKSGRKIECLINRYRIDVLAILNKSQF